MSIYYESDTKLTSKNIRMKKSQSPSPRRSKFIEGSEGLKSVGTKEVSECCTQERRCWKTGLSAFGIREF